MFKLALIVVSSAALIATERPTAASHLKWPPWLSIESPVNPFDPSARGAVLLVHAALREGSAHVADLSGTAEGLVNGGRRSIPLRFDTTTRPNVFAVRRQWPTGGTWMLRIELKQTTALVALDQSGGVASVRVPTTIASGVAIPRAVAEREVDSCLTAAARR